MGISKSKLARAETATGSISSEGLDDASSIFRRAGVVIDPTTEGALRLTLPDDQLHMIATAMSADLATDEVIEDTTPEHRPKTTEDGLGIN